MPQDKVRFQMRISPDTDLKIKRAMPLDNCRSQNEFVEDALNFYCEYLTSKDCSQVLPPIFLSAMNASLQNTENRIGRLLFKQTVELSIMMHILASELDIDPASVDALRAKCVRDVKKTNGGISFKEAVLYQKGID